MISRKLDLKVLAYQNNPEYKEVQKNIDRAREVLSKYTADDKIDFLAFPETAFSGYIFKDKESIRPCSEVAGKGIQFQFLSEMAVKLNCYVFAGYPEYVPPNVQDEKEHFYNAAYLIDRDGTLIVSYKKKHLYFMDKYWCEEGSEFVAFDLKTRDGQVFRAGLGICMDINPYEYIDPTLHELANFHKKQNIDVLLYMSNWDDDKPVKKEEECVERFINNWFKKLSPLINTETEQNYNKNWAWIHCNRIGYEDQIEADAKTRYVGCTCVYQLNPLVQQGQLDQFTEGVLLASINLN